MSSKNSNKLNVPEARAAMDKFKMEAASDLDVPAPYRNLISGVVFFQLVPNIVSYYFRVFTHSIHIIPSAPKVSTSIFVFEICVSIE